MLNRRRYIENPQFLIESKERFEELTIILMCWALMNGFLIFILIKGSRVGSIIAFSLNTIFVGFTFLTLKGGVGNLIQMGSILVSLFGFVGIISSFKVYKSEQRDVIIRFFVFLRKIFSEIFK